MGDICQRKTINNVEIQENGIIRDHLGMIIARLVHDVDFKDIIQNPQPLLEIEEDSLGFCIYKELRGCSTELAKQEWTAKHSNNECKNKATFLAKAITAKFGQRRLRVPKKKEIGKNPGINQYLYDKNTGFNQAIDTFIEMNRGGK